MSSLQSSPAKELRPIPYGNFQGLDDSRDYRAQDINKAQSLRYMDNGFADWRGQLCRYPGQRPASLTSNSVKHLRQHNATELTWAERVGDVINLHAQSGAMHANMCNADIFVTSASFNRKTIYAASGQPLRVFNGTTWSATTSTSNPKPAFICSINRRLAAAGYQGRPTAVDLCRVDNENTWPDDESPGSTDVLRAGTIDIQNLLGSGDVVTGLGWFEQNLLAIFTNDRTLVYQIDPDITQWTILDQVYINFGCASHNTIQRAGNDLLFCSRRGIHSIRRSEYNGLTITSLPMSARIEYQYRALFNALEDPTAMSAMWDQDNGIYHVFFPDPGGETCTRLSMVTSPIKDDPDRFAKASHLALQCGSFFNGQRTYGAPSGIYSEAELEETDSDILFPAMSIQTPVLWGGSLIDTKDFHSVTIQASGQGQLAVTVLNEEDVVLKDLVFDIDSPSDDVAIGVPLSKAYERRLGLRARGIQLRFEVQGSGLIRVVGFGISIGK